jgi:hypothetical protein
MRLLQCQGISFEHLAEILQTLQATAERASSSDGDSPLLYYLSASPATEERLALLQEQVEWSLVPVLVWDFS